MLWVSVLWTFWEFGRTLTPPVLPLVLGGVQLVWWLSQPRKQVSQRDVAWLVLLAVTALGIATSANRFAAFEATKLFAVLFIGTCIPVQTLINSVARARVWILAFVVIAAYVGAWAATHGGYGPAGSDGHDENYVAAIMGLGAGLAYFSIFAERKFAMRAGLAVCLVIYVAALAMAANPSRGGFLALLVVALYGIWRSPRKMLGFGILALGGLALLAFAGDAFWAEIGSSGDYDSGTADVRIEIWKSGVRMWQANPVFGVGGGNFRWVIDQFQSVEQFEKFGRSLGGSIIAHSLHVELLAELGTAGVICTLVLVGTTWVGLGRMLLPPKRLRRKDTPQTLRVLSCYADALRAAILAVLVNGVFLSLLYYSHLWLLLAVGTGLTYIHGRELQRLGLSPSRRPRRRDSSTRVPGGTGTAFGVGSIPRGAS
ncbi:MAG: O-antigen ligase family protein [Gemmatimonadaceae bacterium]|nr:O-antigen ligase family protein [Gemmatimonadaceae bacterium]